MDPRRLESWVTTHEKISGAPARLSSGSSFEQTLRLAGKSFDVRWTVVEANEPRFAEWKGEGPHGSSARVRYELAPLDGKRTRFGYQNEFELPADCSAGARCRFCPHSQEAERSLANLKDLLKLKQLLEGKPHDLCRSGS